MKSAFSLFLVAAVCAALLGACTTQELSRNVYNGVKNRNEALKSAPPDYSSPRAPGYDEYERERRALSGSEPGK
jgi:hypothetical protein